MARLIKIAGWSGEKRGIVIFVHGVRGHPYKSWESENSDGTSWPFWLAEDIKGLSVFSLSYNATLTNWRGSSIPFIDEASIALRVIMNDEEFNQDDLNACPVAFICHSLGGLLVKQMIVSACKNSDSDIYSSFCNRIKRVVFIATPHKGSFMATLAQSIGGVLFRPTKINEMLTDSSSYLSELGREYIKYTEKRTADLHHVSYYETIDTKIGGVVSQSSADPGISNCKNLPIRADHSTIAKPKDKSDLLYGEVKSFIERMYPEPKDYGILQPRQKYYFLNSSSIFTTTRVIGWAFYSIISIILAFSIYVWMLRWEGRPSQPEAAVPGANTNIVVSPRLSFINCPRPAGTTTYDSRHDRTIDPFDGGNWGNLRGGYAWARRIFSTAVRIEGVYVAMAGSDISVDGSIIEINLLNNGTVINVARLRDTTIGRWDIDRNRTLPPQYFSFPAVEVTGVELRMVGHGWFAATDIRVIPEGCIRRATRPAV